MAADHIHNSRFHHIIVFFTGEHLNHVGTQIGGHHNHGVFKIHCAALTIGQAPVVQDLE